jgi:hypothetical protein
VKVYQKGLSVCIELSQDSNDKVFDVNADVEKVEYRGAFVKGVHFFE